MTNKQPEALRLADLIEGGWTREQGQKAAAELRRLHEENEQMKHAIRLCGLTLVVTAAGMQLMQLGEMKAQGDNND